MNPSVLICLVSIRFPIFYMLTYVQTTKPSLWLLPQTLIYLMSSIVFILFAKIVKIVIRCYFVPKNQ